MVGRVCSCWSFDGGVGIRWVSRVGMRYLDREQSVRDVGLEGPRRAGSLLGGYPGPF